MAYKDPPSPERRLRKAALAKKTCVQCGVLLLSVKPQGGRPSPYCSHNCRVLYLSFTLQPQLGCLDCLRPVQRKGRCPACQAIKQAGKRAKGIARRRLTMRIVSTQRALDIQRACQRCGQNLPRRLRRLGRFITFCEACRKKTSRIRNGESHETRAIRHGSRCEYINRLGVFCSAGWRCQLCHIRTPQELLNNHRAPTAPTLDHIVPISRGGSHTLDNVQLLCRQCNYFKGTRLVETELDRTLVILGGPRYQPSPFLAPLVYALTT